MGSTLKTHENVRKLSFNHLLWSSSLHSVDKPMKILCSSSFLLAYT